MKKYLAITFFAILLAAPIGMKGAFGADTWYVGQGLKEGDYFRYDVCQVDYKSCTQFEMDFWVKGKTEHGDWNLQVLVKEGTNKVVKGDMQVGRVAPEPVGFSEGLGPYASAYKSSIVWLSGFTTRLDPKGLDAPAWGKIGSIGGMPVGPTGQKETVTVPGGTFDTVVVGWHKSSDNKIWIAPNLPFPVKALTFVDVTAGTIPVQYQFELLDYGNTANPPDFFDVSATAVPTEEQCPKDSSIIRAEESLDSHGMIVAYSYSPEHPRAGCEITWNFEFEKSFDPNQFESDVHYDIFVINNDGKFLRSFAQEQGQTHLFAPVGKEFRKMDVKEPVGTAHYVIHVYGTGPDGAAPDPTKGGSLQINVDVVKGTGEVITTPPENTTPENTTPETPVITTPPPKSGGGCLIATAAFGSEIAPQIQQLRETRDNVLLSTQSGTAFMSAFNEFYYSFSPTVADWERQNPVFKEVVKTTLTPLITTLSILNYVQIHSETEMLGYGISLILLNIGMYFVAPALVIVQLKKFHKRS